jgi:hypothetical protein
MTGQSKPDLTKLVVTCDLGASLNKIIVQIYPDGVPELITLSPEVADVEKESVLGLAIDSSSQDTAWVGIGDEYYVLGSLAKNIFSGTSAVRDLKYQYALPKLAGLLWLATQQVGVNEADVFIHLLLPPGEYKDGDALGKQLLAALKKGIATPTGKLKLKQRHFLVSIEGSGVLASRRRTLAQAYSQKTIGMLMLGYRNASFTLIRGGNQVLAESTDLGMNWLVERFVEQTAVGLSKSDLLVPKALVEASNGNIATLRSLSRKTKSADIETDLASFQQSLSLVRKEYSRALARWVRNISSVDEVIICGGTGEFVRPELTQYFEGEKIPIVWDGGVKVPAVVDTHNLGSRVADVWTAHITYINVLDRNFNYDRQQPLAPQSKSKTEEAKKDRWKNFLPMLEP